ncbi:MAG: hypothetical protein IJ829_04365, partial [Kiritimatiellae bacterium]|nr:hypothetical protein [Kiritimatiellia bacterium]
RLPAERERARVEAALKAAEGKDPGAILLGATKDARRLLDESLAYRTNRAERAVALADALSARAERIADAWLPVRELVAQSVTNEAQAATIAEQLDVARRRTLDAAQKIADFDEGAYALVSDVEHDLTRFLKLAIPPPQAVEEGLVAQSNAWMDVAAFNGRDWQQDALDYTRAFRAKFPAWAKAYEQRAQSDTNLPPFTAEAQAKISSLSTELEKLQIECVEKALPPNQEAAVGLLAEIQALLPKEKNGGGRQDKPNEPNDGRPPQGDGQPQTPPEPPQNQDANDKPGDDEPQDGDRNDDEPGDEPPEDPESQEVEAVLKKAQERSDEHEAEKKARMRKAPLPPNERDW